MNTATRDHPAGDLRVCDADRDRAPRELSEAFGAGRITAGEFDQRSELEAGIREWINEWNKNPKPFVQVKPADEILSTPAAYRRLINDSAH